MEIDVSEYTNSSTNGMGKDDSTLRPVPPGASGEGLPYAPVDWPSPGDVWTWKVGNKINSSGCYTHRFLIVPKRLQESPSRKIWLGSKPSITRYLQSEFPEADVDAFFASFTWEIPAEIRSIRKAKNRPSRRAMPSKEAEWGSQNFRRTRNSAKKCILLTAEDTTTSMGVHLPGVSADQLSSDSTANKKDQAFDPDAAICPVKNAAGQSALGCKPQDSKSLADYLAEMTSEDFEIYLNSLDDILSESVSRAPNSVAPVLQMEDFAKAREELSSLLAMGVPSLITSNKLSEVTNLSSKLQYDPYLSPGEFSMLNLIQEIPLASKDFLDAKRITAEARKFFMELEASIAHVSELKSDYILSKGKIALLQAEDASASSTIQEIDEQIAILQSRRAILAEVVKTNQKKIADLASTQKQVFDSVPKIVNEVQMANSERSQWELKQKEAAKQEAEILAKFAPLEGFSFRH
ncbi:hypothetical protein Pfo_026245 [Paulownia fortunei]|nr:hypothetical protein Pfo_026245 [Paulownia fortunei]